MSRRALLLCAAGIAAAAAWRNPLRAQAGKTSPHGDLRLECGECHSAEGWKPLAANRAFRHEKTGFPLQGPHAKASCASCHQSQVFNRVGTACADCHRDDPHRGELGQRCESCHSPQTWSNRRQMFQVHSRTRFPLFAMHARLACEDCHAGQRAAQFSATPSDCGTCHSARYQATIDPNHVLAGFSRNCEECHRVTAPNWQLTSFRHPPTPLLVAGGHVQARCVDCHASRFQDTPQACVSCHRSLAEQASAPPHAPPAFTDQCESCHRVSGWRPAGFDHARTNFPLTGAHAGRGCNDCHQGGRYASATSDCVACHRPDYERTSNPGHAAAGFPTECSSCHQTSAWRPASGIDHNRTRFPLSGAHQGVSCTTCHSSGRYAGTSTACNSCHQDDYQRTTNPNHSAGGFPTTCESCHQTSAWRPASGIDHGRTRFPLTGAHQRVNCASCHVNGRYAGTPTACNSCHQDDYQRTTNPNHSAGGFPTTCESCHQTSAWRPASGIDHSRTRFPLTGAHQRVNCTSCHVNGRYAGTPTACNSCHQDDYQRTTNPNHVAGGFPTTCEGCHQTSAWRPASLDHDRTRFPLTGAHRSVSCQSCHRNGQYSGTPTACYSCHQGDYQQTSNPNHAANGFPTTCESCHGTSAWRPSTFNHDPIFPIYSGSHRGRWSACSDCHVQPGNLRVFECVRCHAHSNRTQVDSDHRGVNGYQYLSTACYQCHPRGSH